MWPKYIFITTLKLILYTDYNNVLYQMKSTQKIYIFDISVDICVFWLLCKWDNKGTLVYSIYLFHY